MNLEFQILFVYAPVKTQSKNIWKLNINYAFLKINGEEYVKIWRKFMSEELKMSFSNTTIFCSSD